MQRHRSSWLPLLGVTAGLVLLTQAAAQSPPKSLGEREAAIHVLNRLAFGPTPSQVPEVAKLGWKKWAQQQLDPAKIDDAELDRRIAAECPSMHMSLAEIQDTYMLPRRKADSPEEQRQLQRERNQLRNKLKKELLDAVLVRAVYSKRQFQEVMVEFWRNHFSVDVNKVPYFANHYEENVLRKYAFGTFDDLLLATAKHPAMLVFLDNQVSVKNGLNENYARELMELHTLGVDNHYQQKDVIELARVLTGWTCGRGGRQELGFVFNARTHDDKPAMVLGLKLDGKGGVKDGEAAVRYLARHEGTAQFISRKLCRYLVNDAVSPELVDRVAGVFRATGGNLPEVYRAIVLSPEFLSAKNVRAKFKTPFEFTVSALRATGAEVQNCQNLLQELRLMGQALYECDVPTGYYDQAEAWLDPGVMVYRWNFALHLMTGKVRGVKVPEGQYDTLRNLPPGGRAKKVMELFLPGVVDPQLEATLSRAADPKAMMALALGSASFQQQ